MTAADDHGHNPTTLDLIAMRGTAWAAAEIERLRAEKRATIKMVLSADSGYKATAEYRISANQWAEILKIGEDIKPLSAPPPAREAGLREALVNLMTLARPFHRETDPVWAAIVKQYDAALSQQQETGWRPIESAPKDGTRILAVDAEDGFQVVTAWGKTSHIPIYGWLFLDAPYDAEDIDLWNPTHWRPLPAPPAEGTK